MYIDYTKEFYNDKTDEERKLYIERDKACLENIIREKIANDIVNIVERYYELDDIGYIDRNEKFLELLKEAEQLYYFGYYVGAISVIGISAEEFCKCLVSDNGIEDVEMQIDRIKLLASKKVISKVQNNNLHEIRKIRNKCMHYKLDFKLLEKNELKENAYKIINLFKESLKPLVKPVEIDEIIKKSSTKDWSSMQDFVYRNRNIVRKCEKIDLQISPEVDKMILTSFYFIADIDVETDVFKEITLVDLERGVPVIIDLTLPQAEMFQKQKIKVGNIILASCIASVAKTGLTEEWQLLNLHDICHTVFELEDIDKLIIKS